MEKIHPILQALFKYRFWITCGIVAIASVATWYMAWGKIEKERDQWTKNLEQKKSSIENVINSSVDISEDGKETVDAHPNKTTEKAMEERNVVAARAALEAWKERRERQKEFLVFAPELPDHVVQALAAHEPMELPLPDDKELMNEQYRQTFAEWILKRMPEMTKKVQSTWQFPRDKNGQPIENKDPMASETGKADLVRWSIDNQEIWDSKTSKFEGFNGNPSKVPTSEQCLALQQDLWILGGILDVIAKVNEGYTANDLAPVEAIDHILVGADAVHETTTKGTIGKIESKSGGASKGGGMNMGAKKRGRKRSKKTSKGETFVRSKSKSPFHGYYVNRDFSRLNIDTVRNAITSKTLTEQSYLAVAKRIPVRIAVEIDERRINDFLAAAANSPFAFEVYQVRINKHEINAGFKRTPSGNVGKGDDKKKKSQRDSLSMGGGGDGAVSADDDKKSGRGGGAGGGSDIDEDGANFRSELRRNFDVRVEFVGVVKIYNPVNDKLFFPNGNDDNDLASN